MKQKLILGLAAVAAIALAGTATAQTPATLTDIGGTAPVPGPNDIAQLTPGSGSPDGLNYYFDNSSPPGQTFTTLSDPSGYLLTSLSIATAGNAGSLPAGGQAYLLRIYSVSGATATLLASYISSADFTFTDTDWLQWTGLGVALPAGGQYAYSFARSASGAGWENLANASGNPYAGGQVALIPVNGGTMTLGASGDFDATFVAGLEIPTAVSVNAPQVAPQQAVTAGTAVTLTGTAVGTGPLSYQWQTDGGSGGALTNIPGATASTLAVNTTGLEIGAYQYAVVVTNASSKATSASVSLTITAPTTSAALTSLGATASPGPNDITQFVGGGNRDGLNYYDDNGPNHDGWTGQIFTTGTNSQGYYLTSVAFQTGGGGSSAVATVQPYELFIYSVNGATANLMAHYTNGAFSFTDGDWLQWSGFSLVLRSNATYAYAFGRSATGTGWEALACSPESGSDLYPGGQICLVPAAGGAMTFGTSGNSDAVFDIGLMPIGVGPDPKPFAGTISVTPSRTLVAGQQATLTQAATGAAPLHFQWRTDGGSGTLTNIPGAQATSLVVDTTGMKPGAYQYDFVVTNTFGSATGTVATLTVVYANATAQLVDLGAASPAPVSQDISQLQVTGGSPDGLNYYFDNGSPPGQTFTTGNNPSGYALTSLAIGMAGNRGGLPTAGQAYILRFYTVVDSTATLLATYTSQDGFTYAVSDWLQWSGFAVPLSPNTTYAYTFARSSTGSGWENLGNVAGNPYAGGEVVLIPAPGGTVSFGSSHEYDGSFVIGLALGDHPYVSPVTISPSRSVYAGTPVTLSATVTGTGPFTYQWQTDGGNTGGALTNIPGAVNATLVVDTTPLAGLTVNYDLVVGNGSGSTTSEAAALTVSSASAPIVVTDTTPASAVAFVGGTATFSAVFDGTLPIAYQWQVDKGTGMTNLLGQTNSTLALINLQVGNTGTYSLLASNKLGSLSSMGAFLTVMPQPAGRFTANFQWHSTEGNNDVGNYTGPGVPGYGTGTFWNQIPGPNAWNPGTFTNATSYADNGSTDTGISLTVVTGGSWDWANTPAIPLLFSAASAYSTETFSFNLPNGMYNLVVFSCNGTEAPTANGGVIFTVNGISQTALPTQNTNFILGNTYVVFTNVVASGTKLQGTWAPVPGKSYGSLNGFQVEYLGPALTLSIQPAPGGQVQITWAQGSLQESPTVQGPWTPNPATSPYTVSPSAAQKFYRVSLP